MENKCMSRQGQEEINAGKGRWISGVCTELR